jgi:hypothetical protein
LLGGGAFEREAEGQGRGGGEGRHRGSWLLIPGLPFSRKPLRR